MASFHRLFPIVLSLLTLLLPHLVIAGVSSKARALYKSRYTQTHSLGSSYTFDPRDGWQSVNVTNMARKYEKRNNTPQHSDVSQSGKTKPVSEHIASVFKSIFKLLKPHGPFQKGKTTWYTGNDLKNPSCWQQPSWSPTDDSWKNRPSCFAFLELCSHPEICVILRVVDTCTGCVPEDHQFDLTRRAFVMLFNDADKGEGDVLYRQFPEPPSDNWYEELWGPRVSN
ncbi:hypothetical protein AX14_011401 [Amanita brunnescens Koide BX004]|nr:hypothetical protein AX14_011401 [Amanita brunnescens Koide BX004]